MKNPALKKPKPQAQDLLNWSALLPAPVIGVDEVGRGCLAGPVYAAAVILSSVEASGEDFSEYTDSKLLSEGRREELARDIWARHQVSIAFASTEEIDRLNILQASLLAMHRAVLGLGVSRGHVLVDGNQKIKSLAGDFVQTTVIGGDLRAKPISAASIVAKVARDQWMKELAKRYPGYGFEDHKGYGTAAHKQAISELGVSAVHRHSFRGVREWLAAAPASSAEGVLL